MKDLRCTFHKRGLSLGNRGEKIEGLFDGQRKSLGR